MPALSNTIVLVVDASSTSAAPLLERLQQEGAHVRWVTSIREAVWMLRDAPFLVDVLLCDFAFASRDALDLMRVVRGNRPTPLRAVALMARQSESEAAAPREAGFSRCAVKTDADGIIAAITPTDGPQSPQG